jgi:uncharacterized protein (DUF983 family)
MDYFTAGLITVLMLLFVEMRLASKWSAWVKLLRWIIAGGNARSQTLPKAN